MDARTFYSPSHHRDPFGATDGRPNPHRGLDVGGWSEGTQIPSWCAGTVVVSEWNAALGNVVVVQLVGKNGYAGHSHLRSPALPVGTPIVIDTLLGPLGDTGALSDGPHDHVTWSPSSPYPWIGAVEDPWPRIAAAVFGSTPSSLPSADGSITLQPKASSEMLYARHTNGQTVAFNPAAGSYRYPSAWELNMIANEVVAGRALINPLGSPQWEQTFGPMRLIIDPNESAAAVDVAAIAKLLDSALDADRGAILAAIAAVQTGDDELVLAAIDALPDRVRQNIKANL